MTTLAAKHWLRWSIFIPHIVHNRNLPFLLLLSFVRYGDSFHHFLNLPHPNQGILGVPIGEIHGTGSNLVSPKSVLSGRLWRLAGYLILVPTLAFHTKQNYFRLRSGYWFNYTHAICTSNTCSSQALVLTVLVPSSPNGFPFLNRGVLVPEPLLFLSLQSHAFVDCPLVIEKTVFVVPLLSHERGWCAEIDKIKRDSHLQRSNEMKTHYYLEEVSRSNWGSKAKVCMYIKIILY